MASATTLVNSTFVAFHNVSLPVVINTWIIWNAAREMTHIGSSAKEATRKTVREIATSICNLHAKYYNCTNTQYKT
ncbi:hypothetical protein Ptr902_12647 [Pyrenophora tritici-repentis]|nr:hypothetical protein Ptr902_12647 [Pyrenophora tritici-repentis]